MRARPQVRHDSTVRPKATSSCEKTGLALAEARIRELISDLRGPIGEAGILYHAQIGATVLAHVYGGSIEAWRAGAKRDSSVRELAEQLSDRLPQSSLYRSLAIYEVLLHHAARFPAIRTLGVRALSAISRAPDEAQAALIESALEGRWNGTRIENQVRQLPKRNNGGRPRKHALAKALSQLERTLGAMEAVPLDQIDRETLRKTMNEANEFAEAFDRLLMKLEKAAVQK